MKDLWIVEFYKKQGAPSEHRYSVFENEPEALEKMEVGDYLYKMDAEKQTYLGELKKVIQK